MLFDQVVQAFSFEPILGEVLKLVVQWMVRQPLHLFSMGEKLCLYSALKRLNSGCLFSIIAIGVLFMAPRSLLRPIFRTRSSLLACVLAAIAPALAPYSNVGLTAPVYTVLIILEVAPQCVPASFVSRANFLIPFGAISSICGFNDRRGFNFTPRKIGVSTWDSVLSQSFRVIFFSLRVAREKTVTWVFIMLIWKPHSSVHCCILVTASWIL